MLVANTCKPTKINALLQIIFYWFTLGILIGIVNHQKQFKGTQFIVSTQSLKNFLVKSEAPQLVMHEYTKGGVVCINPKTLLLCNVYSHCSAFITLSFEYPVVALKPR